MYRSAWVAVQEDGTRITLHSPDYPTLTEAVEDRDLVLAIDYVVEAWVEKAEWRRIDDEGEG